MEKVVINSNYITLVQLLKMIGVIQSGGEGKMFLAAAEIKVNNVEEKRRGKKLYIDDIIDITDYGLYKIVGTEEKECN